MQANVGAGFHARPPLISIYRQTSEFRPLICGFPAFSNSPPFAKGGPGGIKKRGQMLICQANVEAGFHAHPPCSPTR